MNFKTKHLMIVIAFVAFLLSVPRCGQLAWELIQDTSYYAPGYSETKFRSIQEGLSEAEVIRLLGNPLNVQRATGYVEWIYGPNHLRVSEDGGLYVNSSDPLNYTIVMADGTGKITSITGSYLNYNEQLLVGHSLGDMMAQFGKPLRVIQQPSQKCLIYSGTKVDGSYYIRNVGIDAAGKVNSIVSRFYQD